MGLAAATANLEWGECIVPAAPVPPALQAEVRKAVGAVPGWLARLAPSPWLVRALCEIIARPFAHAPLEVCNLVALVVSQENSCRYCYGVQRAVLKIFGQRDEHIDALVRDAQVSQLTPAARAALDLARRLTRANPRPGGGDFEALVRAGFSRPAAAEIVFAAAANAPADEDAHAGGDRAGARLRARRGRGAALPDRRGPRAGRARRDPDQPGLAPARRARGPPGALRARDGALPAGRHPAAHARARAGA